MIDRLDAEGKACDSDAAIGARALQEYCADRSPGPSAVPKPALQAPDAAGRVPGAASSSSSIGIGTHATVQHQQKPALAQELDPAPVQDRNLDESSPTVSIKLEMAAWEWPADLKVGDRTDFPIKKPEAWSGRFDLAGFEKFLLQKAQIPIVPGEVSGTTRDKVMQVNRLFDMFLDVEHGQWSIAQVLIGMFRANTINDMLGTALYAANNTWTRKTFGGLISLAACERDRCNRDPALRHMVCDLNNLGTDLDRAYNKTSAPTRFNKRQKGRRDAGTLKRTAPPLVVKDAIKKAMVDLGKFVHDALTYNVSWDALPVKLKGAINTCLIGILFLNSFAGRCGEWEKIGLEEVETQLNEVGRWFIEFCDYKTARYYGELGKFNMISIGFR